MKNFLWLLLAAVSVTGLFLTGRADLGLVPTLYLAGYGLSAVLAQLWVLLTARLQSKVVFLVSLGYGRIVAEAVIGRSLVQLRAVPGPLHVNWCISRAPMARLRVWLGTALSVGLQSALALWLATGGTAYWPVGAGILSATAARVLRSLRGTTGTGRILLLMPFRPSSLALGSEANIRAGVALWQGRIAELRAVAPELAPEDNPDFDLAVLALAEGRYADAEERGRRCLAQAGSQADAVDAALIIGSAIVGAADAGELPPDRYLPRLMTIMGEFNGPPKAVLRNVPAAIDFARLENRLDDAVAAGHGQRGMYFARFWRAEADCSLAAALGATGRFDEARVALQRARKNCPGLARIALVERQLEQWAAAAPVEVRPVRG
ncbi:hypothetical protein, partial [Kitasatospora sp. A2-31]|uniref:hypothetical protein n=1 Tax=Kitasatospora sp. A2-31 TaxID=2916414 RepID=UPI001EEE8F35